MIRRWLCRTGLHRWKVVHNGEKFTSTCRWCGVFEKGYEP